MSRTISFLCPNYIASSKRIASCVVTIEIIQVPIHFYEHGLYGIDSQLMLQNSQLNAALVVQKNNKRRGVYSRKYDMCLVEVFGFFDIFPLSIWFRYFRREIRTEC